MTAHERLKHKLEALKPGSGVVVSVGLDEYASYNSFHSAVVSVCRKLFPGVGSAMSVMTRKQSLRGAYATFVYRLPEGVQ